MIYGFARDIETSLRARKYPVRVVYGPEALERAPSPGAPLVVFERDREQGDGVGFAKGARGNELAKRVRGLGVIITVYAASSAHGARPQDHEHACDQIVDALMVAIDEWFVAGKTGTLALYQESRMMNAAEFETDALRAWPGCVYRLRFDLPRGVRALDYTPPKDHAPGTVPGESRPTATVARFGGGEAHVHRQGSDEDPEIVDIPGDPIDP